MRTTGKPGRRRGGDIKPAARLGLAAAILAFGIYSWVADIVDPGRRDRMEKQVAEMEQRIRHGADALRESVPAETVPIPEDEEDTLQTEQEQ